MRYTDRPKDPISTKDMLRSLLEVRPAMEKMQGMSKEYCPLIAALLGLDPEAALPTAKSLQQLLGISSGVLRRWLETWHHDFLELIEQDADVLQFREVEYLFCVPGPRDYRTFRCRMAVTPRVGEGVDLPFMRGVTGSDTYHVDSIFHEYQHERVQVIIHLREGYYDPYVHHLRHRARFERTLTWDEESTLSGYEAEDRLHEIYKQLAPTPPPRPVPVRAAKRRYRG